MPKGQYERQPQRQLRLEKRIKKMHDARVKLDLKRATTHYQIGRLLVTLRDKVIPTGQWKAYLENPKTTQRLGFSTATAWRYVAGYEDAEAKLKPKVVTALEEKGINVTSPKILSVVEKVQAEEPRLGTAELAERVGNVIAFKRRRLPRSQLSGVQRIGRVVRLLVSLYRRAPDQLDAELAKAAVEAKQKLAEAAA